MACIFFTFEQIQWLTNKELIQAEYKQADGMLSLFFNRKFEQMDSRDRRNVEDNIGKWHDYCFALSRRLRELKKQENTTDSCMELYGFSTEEYGAFDELIGTLVSELVADLAGEAIGEEIGEISDAFLKKGDSNLF